MKFTVAGDRIDVACAGNGESVQVFVRHGNRLPSEGPPQARTSQQVVLLCCLSYERRFSHSA